MLLRHTPRRNRGTLGPDHQPGQDLPAHRGHVRGPGHPQLPAAQPRLAGLLRLPPQHPDPALQGAGHGRHQLLHRRRLGVRRPGQPAPGHQQHLHRLRARRHRRPHHLPVGDHRRRHPADHRQGQGRGQDSRRASTSSTPTRPSYVGSHVTGFANMVKGMVDYFAEANGHKENRINIIPGWVEPSDMGEIKRLAGELGCPADHVPRHLRRAERSRRPASTTSIPKGGATVDGVDRGRQQHGHPGPGPAWPPDRRPGRSTPSARCPARSWTCPSACGPPTASSTRCGSSPA